MSATPHPTFYVRRSVYEQHGGFDTSFHIAADYDCMLRFLARPSAKVNVAYIPSVLVKMRLGGASNRSLGNIIRKSREDYRALKQNGVGGLWALAWKNLSKLPQFFRSPDRGARTECWVLRVRSVNVMWHFRSQGRK